MYETGKLIQELRIKAGFTQKSLADALHITDKAVSKWERGLSLPDITLLQKLSLLLDTDTDRLVATSIKQEKWVGLIDIHDCDFSQIIYDKPLVYYLLVHFQLLGMEEIYILTEEMNKRFLQDEKFSKLGFIFIFEEPVEKNMMIINHPWFLFGSDLTEQFQGAMLSKRRIKLVPKNQEPIFLFSMNRESKFYFEDKKQFVRKASERTLGRGMVCLDMSDYNGALDVATFIRAYQQNSGLLIGDVEEIAYRNGMISKEQLLEYASIVPYGNLLREIPT